MKNNKSYVLDTSAIFCLKDNEEGAAQVEKILQSCGRGECEVYVSFISLMEFLYISIIRRGKEIARRFYLQLSLLPLITVESDEDIRIAAAELKANYNISLADSWIAATALETNSILVHKDPEYEPLNKIIKILALPYK